MRSGRKLGPIADTEHASPTVTTEQRLKRRSTRMPRTPVLPNRNLPGVADADA